MTNARIDRSRYVVVPRTTVRRLIALGIMLERYAPPDPDANVEYALEVLSETTADTARGYTARVIELGPSLAASEAAIDTVVDHLFGELRNRLQSWHVFQLDDVARMAKEQKPGTFDFRQAQAKAETAKHALDVLFADGLGFVKAAYMDQQVHMQALDQVRADEGLDEALEELVGLPFMAALAEYRQQYTAMLDRRTQRAKGSSVNLREQARILATAINNYVIALLGSIRDDDEDNVAVMARALRPIDALREQINADRARAAGGQTEPEQGDVNPLVGELLAEEQAIDDVELPDDSL
jgi:hypothetical protein